MLGVTPPRLEELLSSSPPDFGSAQISRQARDLRDQLVARAKETRLRMEFDGRAFSGAGWDRLLAEAQTAHFVLLGEEHGVSQIPALARQLMLALRPSGYERLALEISAPVAMELDRAALAGIDGIRRFNAEYPPGPAFYNYREEAEFVAEVRKAFPASMHVLWGLDYEVIQDRRLIARLRSQAPPEARAAVRALEDASAALWNKYETTRNPQFIFSFAGDPALIKAIRTVWREPDSSSSVILDVLEGTLETNALWVKGRAWESNDRRTTLMRAALARYWRAEKARGRSPKVMFKFGASHMARGRDMSEVYDIGDMAAEAAALDGGHSYHVFIAPPRSAQHGRFNPATMGLTPVPASYFDEQGVGFLADVAFPDAFTFLDIRALRPVLGFKTTELGANASRVVHGFDAMIVLSGATPSVMLS
jgi:hypothetical protein